MLKFCAFVDFQEPKFNKILKEKIARFLYVAQSGSKYIEEFFKIKLLPCLNFSQIWLNLPVDHHHFGYNTKLQKRKNTNWVIMSVGGFLRKDTINPSLLSNKS